MHGDGVKILIVGAGTAGLAAARTLHDWGADVRVVEREAKPSVDGTGIFLPGNAMRALDDLGVAPQVTARGITVARQRISDRRGRVLMEIDNDDLWGGVAPCVAVHRVDLHEVLLAAAKNVPIVYDRAPISLVDTDDGVLVEFDDRSSDTYDLVIGADGVHSTVRRLAFGDAGLRPLGQIAVRFVATVPDPEPVWSLTVHGRAALLTIPIGGDRVYCYSDGVVPLPAPLVATAGPAHRASVEEVHLDRWSNGLTVLIGDAAHATGPNMAQGSAMAVEDALVLADSLARSRTIAEALAQHERRRRPRVDHVRKTTNRRDSLRAIPEAVRAQVFRSFGPALWRMHYGSLRGRP
ncbi:FAD-dependent monooxygenase [Cryptosporangium aurantiacum]|uniref:2-polyprenyl-6-methoxyphenol hydroxylase n=1 Tax=Cryptosporangium aurantiacum TaxID=134849 RepID=A0A1M7RKA1_9ACTN|nr:FAD-dependent monooxygenase [Cryptosporangium aurantiacum]SHN46576.1 2-polyprenyl-6-methoxyphenol hydroxylase [Cryptosporangium aurantiacum]